MKFWELILGSYVRYILAAIFGSVFGQKIFTEVLGVELTGQLQENLAMTIIMVLVTFVFPALWIYIKNVKLKWRWLDALHRSPQSDPTTVNVQQNNVPFTVKRQEAKNAKV